MPFSPQALRHVRRVLLGLTVFATVIALAVMVENWRGRQAWRRYVGQQAARGIDLVTLPQPTSLPAASNFMRTPLLDRWLLPAAGKSAPTLQEFRSTYDLPRKPGPSEVAWQKGQMLDLQQCVDSFVRKLPAEPATTSAPIQPAEALLRLQRPLDSVLEELRNAARERPESQMVRSQTIDLLNQNTVYYFPIVRVLAIDQVWHACASLAAARSEVALYDTLATLKVFRGLADAPDTLLIDTMVATTGYNLGLQPVWEGLQRRSWTEPQLALLAQELARADLLGSLQRSVHTERVAGALVLDQLSWTNSAAKKAIKESSPKELAWLLYFPFGWIQQNKLHGSRWYDRLDAILALHTHPGFVEEVRHVGEMPPGAGSIWSPFTLWAFALVPAYDKIVPSVVHKQALLRLAVTACALERYRLAHGRYPAQLADLVPAFLDKVPLDPVDGQPLHYRSDDATGRFSLYSIGLDGKDEGGISHGVQKPTDPGDWVWPQPAFETK